MFLTLSVFTWYVCYARERNAMAEQVSWHRQSGQVTSSESCCKAEIWWKILVRELSGYFPVLFGSEIKSVDLAMLGCLYGVIVWGTISRRGGRTILRLRHNEPQQWQPGLLCDHLKHFEANSIRCCSLAKYHSSSLQTTFAPGDEPDLPPQENSSA